MASIIPRYEFRLFAQHFGHAEQIIRKHPVSEEVSECDDLYILSRNTNRMNAKIRSNMLIIKELLSVEDGMEKWQGRSQLAFPISEQDLEDEVLPLLGVRRSVRLDDLTQDEFLDRIVRSGLELVQVQVRKRRQLYLIGDCKAEISDILVNGAFIRTLGIESEKLESLMGALQLLGIEGEENVNYQLALKRITGMTQWPKPPEF